MADLGAEDLWHIGNTRRPQFTAHYLPRPTPRSRIFRRRLLLTSRFSSLFLLTGSYLDDCAIFSLALRSSISFLLSLLRTSMLVSPCLSIFLPIFLILSLLCFFSFWCSIIYFSSGSLFLVFSHPSPLKIVIFSPFSNSRLLRFIFFLLYS